MTEWKIEIEGPAFRRFVKSLTEYEQAVLFAAIEAVLVRLGPDVCETEWGKHLGRGLYEFRIRRSLNAVNRHAQAQSLGSRGNKHPVLLRVFFVLDPDRVILLLGGYNKKKDDSALRQQKEILKARHLLDAWRERERG